MAEIDVTVEGGPGRRLVLLHGFTQGPGSWDRVVAGLVGSYEIVRVTLPGHGPAGSASAQARMPFEVAAGSVADATISISPTRSSPRRSEPLSIGESTPGVSRSRSRTGSAMATARESEMRGMAVRNPGSAAAIAASSA